MLLVLGTQEDCDSRVCLVLEAAAIQAQHTYISKLDLAYFAQRIDNLSTNLIRDVELGQGHVAGAEEGILRHGHDAKGWDVLATKALLRVHFTQSVTTLSGVLAFDFRFKIAQE